MEILIKASQLILSLSILVVLHEFGHFLPAKAFKTKVEKFYLFFNPWFSLFKKKIGETEWGIGWLPLGGYVKIAGMVDESMDTEQLAKPAEPWEFRSKPAWQRLIIMLGGIIVNIILGFALYIMIAAVWGESRIDQKKLEAGISVTPFLQQYGFQNGDQIISIDGEACNDFTKGGMDILLFGAKTFVVKHANGTQQTIQLPDDIGKQVWQNNAENAFGFRSKHVVVDSVIADKPASKAGIQKGDSLIAVNGENFLFFDEFQTALYKNKGKKVELQLYRGDSLHTVSAAVSKEGTLGFMNKMRLSQDTAAVYTQEFGFLESISQGFSMGYEKIYANVAQFKYVFTKKGAESVGGFARIGSLFPATWNWQAFWSLTAFLSMMLAIMNLLPIPALDGGHVVFLLYEMITGKEMPQKVLEIAQYVGVILLLGLMLYANGNDVYRLLLGK